MGLVWENKNEAEVMQCCQKLSLDLQRPVKGGENTLGMPCWFVHLSSFQELSFLSLPETVFF